MNVKCLIHCGILLSAVLNANAQNLEPQSILINGSFENYGGSGNSNIGAGLTGWTIGNAGGIDIVFSTGVVPYYWKAADGDVSLSLAYFGPDSVTQTVATQPGKTYRLTFSMAAEIYGGPPTRTMDVLWNNSVVSSPSFQYTGQGPENMGWTQFSLNVVGTGTDSLSFLATSAGNYGPALDNVSLVLVPEPATASLVVLGLIGFGLSRQRL